jgi:hypothetical protein
MALDHCGKPLGLYMRVDLRRRNVGVAKHRLNGAQIGPMRQQVARKRVSQHMRRKPGRVQTGLEGQLLQQLRHTLPGQMAAARPRWKEPFRTAMAGKGPPKGQPVLQGRAGPAADRHHAFLAALATHRKMGAIGRQGGERERDELGDAQTRRVEQLQQRRQPNAFRALAVARGVDQRRDLILVEHLGQWTWQLRPVYFGCRVVAAPALEEQKAMKLADRRKMPGRSRRRHAALRQVGQMVANVIARRVERVATASPQEAFIIGEVATVGVQGVL